MVVSKKSESNSAEQAKEMMQLSNQVDTTYPLQAPSLRNAMFSCAQVFESSTTFPQFSPGLPVLGTNSPAIHWERSQSSSAWGIMKYHGMCPSEDVLLCMSEHGALCEHSSSSVWFALLKLG